MAKSVAQLTEQMHRLQQQIEAAKAKEVAGVIARIKEAIEHYDLTPQQLFSHLGTHKTKAISSAAKKSPARKRRVAEKADKTTAQSRTAGLKLPAKFSDGAGNSWTGRGRMPRWLTEAMASGQTKEQFAVKI
jgi:DNA-binding protein H-NS